MPEIAGLLLAAGYSQRFGHDKTLHRLPNGTPMAVAALQNLLTALGTATAIIRPEQQILWHLLEAEGAEVIVSETAYKGMGNSLADGVAATANADGWIIALADMPFIQPQTITRLATALQRNTVIAAPVFQRQRGHPVAFGHRYREALLCCCGEHGAHHLLQTHARHLRLIETSDSGVVFDIDQPDNVEKNLSDGRNLIV